MSAIREPEFHDVECGYCGERFVEITRVGMFDALVDHRCAEAELLMTDIADVITRWKRHDIFGGTA